MDRLQRHILLTLVGGALVRASEMRSLWSPGDAQAALYKRGYITYDNMPPDPFALKLLLTLQGWVAAMNLMNESELTDEERVLCRKRGFDV